MHHFFLFISRHIWTPHQRVHNFFLSPTVHTDSLGCSNSWVWACYARIMESLILDWNWGAIHVLFPIIVSLRDHGCHLIRILWLEVGTTWMNLRLRRNIPRPCKSSNVATHAHHYNNPCYSKFKCSKNCWCDLENKHLHSKSWIPISKITKLCFPYDLSNWKPLVTYGLNQNYSALGH